MMFLTHAPLRVVLAATLASAACTAAPGMLPSENDVTEAVVTAAGGVLRSGDGRVTLTVPPGALTQSTRLTLRRARTSHQGALGPAWEMGPDGTRFAVPATLSLAYQPEDLGAVAPNDVVVATYLGGRWVPRPFVVAAPSERRVAVTVGHLSEYALVPRPDTPCECDAAVWAACCRGTTPMPCTCVETVLPFTPFEDFVDCYARGIGTRRVSNFSSGCLRRCCLDGRGAPTPGGACVLSNGAALDPILACGLRCYASASEPAALCGTTPTPTCPIQAGVFAGTLTTFHGVSNTSIEVRVAPDCRVRFFGASASSLGWHPVVGGAVRQSGPCDLTQIAEESCCDWEFVGDALVGRCTSHTSPVCAVPGRCPGTCHGLVCGMPETYRLTRLPTCTRHEDCPPLRQCLMNTCFACEHRCDLANPCPSGWTCETFGVNCSRCQSPP